MIDNVDRLATVMLQPDVTLGPYRITAMLGRGGMGEVYLARDTRLDRDVAVKALPAEFVANAERLARFDREAKVLASLNHANIAAIYGTEESAGAKYLILEYVAGESLERLLHPEASAAMAADAPRAEGDPAVRLEPRDAGQTVPTSGDAGRNPRGRLMIDDVLRLAGDICRALEAAHERGVVHRDLKPANIMITADGQIKVLDFGLASVADAAGLPGSSSALTMTALATHARTIVGTPAYMSPEQAKGLATDKRADIWAFGCVLYEMLAGKRAFGREDVTETLAAVVGGEPDWAALPPSLPPRILDLLKACLRRDVRDRVPDVTLVRYILDDKASLRGDRPAATASATRSTRWRFALGGTFLVLAVAAGWALKPTRGAPLSIARFTYVLPQGQAFTRVGRHTIAISGDGRRIVYVANQQLYVRELDQLESAPIRGTQEDPMEPVFSPDGTWIAYFAQTGAGTDVWQLKKVPVAGGTPMTLATIGPAPVGASWHERAIFYGAGQRAGIFAISDAGGEPRLLVDGGSGRRLAHPWMLDDGTHLVFTSGGSPAVEGNIEIATNEGKDRKTLVTGGSDPRVVQNSVLVYIHEDQLFAAPFNASRRELTGPAVPVEENVFGTAATATGQFAIATTGTLVFMPGTSAQPRQLLWVDRDGSEEPLAAPPHTYQSPRISPDGTKIAVNAADGQRDLWIIDLKTQATNRLTFTADVEREPVWASDSKNLVFSSTAGPSGNDVDLFRAATDGSGSIERLTQTRSGGLPQALSRDGHLVLIKRSAGAVTLEALLLGPGGLSQQSSLASEGYNYLGASISPDGRWIAFAAGKTAGSAQVYVRRFPNMTGQQWQVSTGGGTAPLWGPDGRELFYTSPSAGSTELVRVPVDTTSGFSAGRPERLFAATGYYAGLGLRAFDISPDGRRFIVVKPIAIDSSTLPSFVVVLNWSSTLAARLYSQRP